jgi:hypothetical protein
LNEIAPPRQLNRSVALLNEGRLDNPTAVASNVGDCLRKRPKEKRSHRRRPRDVAEYPEVA